MFVVVCALAVLGSVIYILITVLSYLSQSGSLNMQLEDLQASIAHKESRFEEYRLRAEQLQENVPQIKQKVEQYKQWISALKKQQALLKAQTKGQTSQERDAVIKRSLSSTQKRKG